ncbi:MAG: flavodoxin family protein [Acidobacteriota bacterium]|jgi:multimeric flavodoxin WrbA
MKILGISGSPRQESTARLVREVLDATGEPTEFISLKGKKIGGCVACLGCVRDNVCIVEDDMKDLRQNIVEADAYVIGGANYFMALNGLTHSFLERWYQFRHRSGQDVTGKLAVSVGVGGATGAPVAEQIETFMAYNLIDTVGKVAGQGAACCFICGYGETCEVGAVRMLCGPGVKITDDMIPKIDNQAEVLQAARDAGKLLGERLRAGNDRTATAQRMASYLGERFKEAT